MPVPTTDNTNGTSRLTWSQSLWDRGEGQGPTRLGRVYSILRSVVESLRSPIQRCSQIFKENTSIGILKTRGKQCTTTVLSDYINLLVDKKAEDLSITTIYVNKQTNVKDQFTKTQLDDVKKNKIAIPIILQSNSLLQLENHIVYLFIDKEKNLIEYFDSKGISAKNTHINNSNATMQNVIDRLRQEFFPNQEISIVENKKVLQLDCHSCGIFVISALKTRIFDNKALEDKYPDQSPLTAAQTQELRENLLHEMEESLKKNHEF